MRKIIVLLALFVCCFIISNAQTAESKQFDIVIKNARIIDGTGNPWFKADIGITNGRIAKIGTISDGQAKEIIDAQNQIVAPGFIDVHTHTENVFNNPDAENFIRMGVTSLVTGNCGGSVIDVGKFLNRYQDAPLAVNLATPTVRFVGKF